MKTREGNFLIDTKGWVIGKPTLLPISKIIYCITLYPSKGELYVYPDGTKHFIKAEL